MTERQLAEWLGISENLARRYRTGKEYEKDDGRDWPEHHRVVRGTSLAVRYKKKAVRDWAKRLPKGE